MANESTRWLFLKSRLPRVAAAATLVLGAAAGCATLRAGPAPPRATAGPSPTAAPPTAAERETLDERTRLAWAAIERKQEKLATRGPKPFDQPAERHRFFMEQRLAPGQADYPFEAVRAALDGIRAREAALRAASPLEAGAAAVPTWSWLGPGNIGGRTRAIVFDPVDPDVMYAGGVAGGVWKSTDGGASWAALDDLMLNLAVASLAVDPANGNVLYAGTGEGVLGGRPGLRGLGIFKSVDAGVSWTQLAGTVDVSPSSAFHYVNRLLVSPSDSNRVYAATRTGVWRSLDAGTTWAVVLANPRYLSGPRETGGCQLGCMELVIRPGSSPDRLFATFGNSEADGLFRSDDGGDTWVQYTVPANQGRMSLAFAPSDPDIMYLLMADNGTVNPRGQLVDVYRSDDGGLTWAPRVDFGTVTGPWLLSNLVLATGCVAGGTYSQGWYDNVIAVDPLDPDVVWVGGVDIFRSDDGGRTFRIPGYWIFYLEDPPPPTYIHPDHHVIAFHPDYDGVTNQTMYVGNDGGIYRTQNARAATSDEDCPLPGDDPLPEIVWESMNNGYGVTQFYHGAVAVEIDLFVGGAQDNGTSRGLGLDPTQDWKMIFGGDGGYAAVSHENGQVVYVTYQGFPRIHKSLDGGDTFAEATAGITDTDGLFITPLAMDPGDPATLWTGGSRPWRTLEAGDWWLAAGPDLDGPAAISAIAVAPSDRNVVYLGFNNGYVARTTNGLSPSPAWETFTDGLVGAWASSVAVDPDDPDVAYVTYSSFGVPHVLRSTNGGTTWTSIDGIAAAGVPDIPVHWIAVRPCDGQDLFAGTELGVFHSTDGGGNWQPFNDGLAHTVVESLAFRGRHRLVAFTHGRGAFQVVLPTCASCPADVDGDDVVAVGDLLMVLARWGETGVAGDADGDGVIGVGDALAVLADWGGCS